MHFEGIPSARANSWFGSRFLYHQVADELWLCYYFSLYCVREVWSLPFQTGYKQLSLAIECESQGGCKYVCD